MIHPEVRRKCRSKTGIARPGSVASYLKAFSRGKAAFETGVALSIDSLRIPCTHHYTAKDLFCRVSSHK